MPAGQSKLLLISLVTPPPYRRIKLALYCGVGADSFAKVAIQDSQVRPVPKHALYMYLYSIYIYSTRLSQYTPCSFLTMPLFNKSGVGPAG